MKKSLLTERFQQLAGIKSLYELNEDGTHNDGTPAAKQISTNKPLRNNILKYIESILKPGQSVEKLFQMEDVAKEYIKNYVTEKEPHYKAIADSKDDMHMWYQAMQQHLQGSLDEELKENEGQATPYPFESVNDVMRYFADNNVSIIEPYLIKSINGTLEEEEENSPVPLTPERIGEIVEQIINAEVRR